MQTDVELCSVGHRAVMLKIPHTAGIEYDLGQGEYRPVLSQNRPGEQQKCYEGQPNHKSVTGTNQPCAHRGLHRRVLHQAETAVVIWLILVMSSRARSFHP